MVLCLCGILVSVLAMIKPDGLRETPATPNEIFWFRVGGPFLILACVYGFLFFWKACLILKPNEILIRGRFSTKRILLSEIKELLWGYEKALNVNGIYLRLEGHEKLFQLDWYMLVADYRDIVRYLRTNISRDKQVNWKEYYLQNRLQMVRPKDRKWPYFIRVIKDLLFVVLFIGGFFGCAFLVTGLGIAIADKPWLLSGFFVLFFLIFSAFILWPRKRHEHKSWNITPCPVSLKVVTVLFFLYVLFFGLGLIWEWFSDELFAVLAPWGLLIGLCGGGDAFFCLFVSGI